MKSRIVWLLLSLFMLSFVGASSAPIITEQPLSHTALVGQRVVFTVTASGDELAYQWQKNGADIPNANGPTHEIQAATLADTAAFFQVRVSNDKGSVTSCIAMLIVTESGTPGTSPPVCPEQQQPSGDSGNTGGGSGGCGGGGGGGGGASSSGGSSGEEQDPGNPDERTLFPQGRWKGSIKATKIWKGPSNEYTSVVEGDVTFETFEPDPNMLAPYMFLSTVEGSLTYRRTGNQGPGCYESMTANGTIRPGDGKLTFRLDVPPPQHATQFIYEGGGASKVEGTETIHCNGTNSTNEWSENANWMLVGPDTKVSRDMLVISGTYVHTPNAGESTTYEWHLVKQH